MQLAALPILQEQLVYFQYSGGAPDDFLWNAIDPIGDRVQRRTDGSNLVPELLDPYVFAQFVSGLIGAYTVTGMPFANNWRLLPAAARMAARLDCADLADALNDAEKELQDWDIADLDAFDAGRLDYNDPGERAKNDALFARFDQRFLPFIENAQPGYGHLGTRSVGGTRLLSALCEWISDAMPREVVASQEEIAARIAKNHDWAWDTVENYGFEYTRYHVGVETFQMLESLGLRFAQTTERALKPHELEVLPLRLRTTDGQDWISFSFGDGMLLADAATLTEHARFAGMPAAPRPDHLPRYLNMADRPKITLVDKPFITKRASVLRPFAKTLTYKVQ